MELYHLCKVCLYSMGCCWATAAMCLALQLTSSAFSGLTLCECWRRRGSAPPFGLQGARRSGLALLRRPAFTGLQSMGTNQGTQEWQAKVRHTAGQAGVSGSWLGQYRGEASAPRARRRTASSAA